MKGVLLLKKILLCSMSDSSNPSYHVTVSQNHWMNCVEKDFKDHIVPTSLLQAGLPLVWALEWASTVMVWHEAVFFRWVVKWRTVHLTLLYWGKPQLWSWPCPEWFHTGSRSSLFAASKPGSTRSSGGECGNSLSLGQCEEHTDPSNSPLPLTTGLSALTNKWMVANLFGFLSPFLQVSRIVLI